MTRPSGPAWARSSSSRESPSPVDAAAVAEEAAGRLADARRRPDDRRGAFLHAAAGAAPAHVRPHPARADGVDDDPARAGLRRPDADERVERDLRDAVGGRRPAALAVTARPDVRDE